MIKKVQYDTAEDRAVVLTENSNIFFIEEQNITEGNFLIFTDVPPTPVSQIVYTEVNQEEFNKLIIDTQTLQDAVADIILNGGGF